LIGENADEALDTLKEIADWIQQHPEDASAMNSAIEKNAGDIVEITKENGTIDTKVAAAEGRVDEKLKDYAKTSEVEDALKAYSTTEQMNAAIKVVGDKADANATAIENITKDGGAIANAISAAEGRVAETYATKQALTDGLAGKVDNDAFTTYQGTVTEALAGKATVAAVEKNAEDIEALQTQVNTGLAWARFE
jgi:predicted  nucleic acid-binding Zn-ribbon protein